MGGDGGPGVTEPIPSTALANIISKAAETIFVDCIKTEEKRAKGPKRAVKGSGMERGPTSNAADRAGGRRRRRRCPRLFSHFNTRLLQIACELKNGKVLGEDST